MRTHNKVDTQDQFEPTLIGRAVGVRSLMPKSPGKGQSSKIPENKSSKITGSFPQKRNQLMLQWLKCKNNCTFRFIINLYENMSFLFTVLVPKLPFSFQQNINQTYCFKRHLANDLFEKNGVLSKWGRINTRWFKVTFWSPSWSSLSHSKGHLTIPKRSQRIARYKLYCQHFHHGGNIITLRSAWHACDKSSHPGHSVATAASPGFEAMSWGARTLVRFFSLPSRRLGTSFFFSFFSTSLMSFCLESSWLRSSMSASMSKVDSLNPQSFH